MTKLVKPHPPHTPPRTNSHNKDSEFKESQDTKEPKESKNVAFPTTIGASPLSTPSKSSKLHRSSKLSTSSGDNHEVQDALRLRKPSLLKTVKRASAKQLRSISSTLTNSAHRITLHGHGHGHHIDHSSESSESSQLSEPTHLSHSFDSSHLAQSSHSSESSEHPELAESESPSKGARRRRVSLPSFRLLRPSSYHRTRTGSSAESVFSTATPVPTVPARSDLGVGRSYSSPSISTERNESTVLSPVLASASVSSIPSPTVATSPSPTAVSVSSSSADGEAKESRDASLAVRDDTYHETDAQNNNMQETQIHPPGLTISVELVQTSPNMGGELAQAQMPSANTSGGDGAGSMTPSPPLPSSSRSVSSLFFSYTLPPSASSNRYNWVDDIDESEDDEGEEVVELNSSDDESEDEDIEGKKDMIKVDSRRVSRGPFISSIFILVPVFSIRKPLGFYLTWWLGRNV